MLSAPFSLGNFSNVSVQIQMKIRKKLAAVVRVLQNMQSLVTCILCCCSAEDGKEL